MADGLSDRDFVAGTKGKGKYGDSDLTVRMTAKDEEPIRLRASRTVGMRKRAAHAR